MSKNKTILEPDWGFDICKFPQFEIRHIDVRRDTLFVLGVAHSAIKVGDRFTNISRFAPQENTQDRIGNLLITVNLKVASITAYHQTLNRINADMTAGLELTGNRENILETFHRNGWTIESDKGHQWHESVLESEKLILTQ